MSGQMRWLPSALGLAVVLAGPALGRAQFPSSTPIVVWGPNGAVSALALDGDVLHVGGVFDQVGPATGTFAIADPNDATAFIASARTALPVELVTPDGSGGRFVVVVTGDTAPFAPTSQLLHVLANGALDPAWSSPVPNGRIFALAYDTGRLFVGRRARRRSGRTGAADILVFLQDSCASTRTGVGMRLALSRNVQPPPTPAASQEQTSCPNESL